MITKDFGPVKVVAGRASEGATRSDAMREYNIVTDERETVCCRMVVL